jgi:hypothetical protein
LSEEIAAIPEIEQFPSFIASLEALWATDLAGDCVRAKTRQQKRTEKSKDHHHHHQQPVTLESDFSLRRTLLLPRLEPLRHWLAHCDGCAAKRAAAR